MKTKILLLVIGLAFIGCRPIYQTEYIHTKDSIYNTIYDSIYIKEYQKNETIFIETNKIKYEYKYQYKVDTIKDTIQTTKYINRTQKVKQKGWKGYLWGFGTALFLMIGLFIYKRFR